MRRRKTEDGRGKKEDRFRALCLTSSVFRLPFLALALALLAGCAHTPSLPPQPLVDPRTAVSVLAEQDAHLKTASGEGSVTLTRADGQSVRLDTALAAQFPDDMRLRAWKMGQAVFDMTMTPDGVWMLVADPSRRDKLLPAGASAADFMRGWASLHSGFYSDAKLEIRDVSADTFYLERPAEKEAIIRAEIDRATLTVRRHMVLDDKRVVRFTIEYDRYRLVDGLPWPMRLRARGEQGLIEVQFDDVQLNGPPAPQAFVPPKRAEKLR